MLQLVLCCLSSWKKYFFGQHLKLQYYKIVIGNHIYVWEINNLNLTKIFQLYTTAVPYLLGL